MDKKVKQIINLILAAVALAMGVAAIVLTTIKADVTTNEIVKMLAIAIVSLGLYVLSNTPKDKI